MKRLIMSLTIIGLVFVSAGCLKRDEFQDIDILTTSYATEYITNYIYGEYSTTTNIYPDGTDPSKYVITNKRINDYSKTDLFIYNGLSKEKEVAASLINKNKDVKIIDISQGLEIKFEEEELWLNPTNKLMLAQNIKNGLSTYVKNKTILNEIEQNYNNLKVTISEYDAELNLVSENAKNKTLVIANNSLQFLEKYGFEVININNNESSSTDFSKAVNLFRNKTSNYLFALDTIDTKDKDIKKLVDAGAEVKKINTLKNLSEDSRKNNEDYETFMNNLIEFIKEEVY